MAYQATYNNINLNQNGYKITKIELGMPKPIINKYNLVRADGLVVTNSNYGERNILITGSVEASNVKDMDIKLDTLKSTLIGIEKNLDVVVADVQRRYIATVESFNYTISGYFCTYEINFVANSFGKDTETTSLTFGTYTSGDEPYTNTILGSYNTSPSLELSINIVEPFWLNKYINIANSALNQTLRITDIFKHNDVITINSENKTITKISDTTGLFDSCDSITGWTSSNTLSLEETNQAEGAGALKVVMASASASTSVSKLNTNSKDLSSIGAYFIIPIYIPTPTSGTVASVDLKLGSAATLASNYNTYNKTTQVDGSAIAYDEWNYFKFIVSDSPTASSGTLNKSAVISYSIILNATTTMKLNGVLIDYITNSSTTQITSNMDYEGIFPTLDIGSSTLTISDEFTRRKIAITGEYYKRYL